MAAYKTIHTAAGLTAMNLLLLLLLLSGCGLLNTNQNAASQSVATKTIVTVQFASADKVDEICKDKEEFATNKPAEMWKYYGCALVKQNEPGVTVCEIAAEEPKDFADTKRLAILGHELWHCLGATHVNTFERLDTKSPLVAK